jgi:hypothetical protein
MNTENLAPALLDTLENTEDLNSVTRELTEVILDECLEDGIVKNIPIVSVARGLVRATVSFSNYVLCKKLLAFLNGIKDIPKEQRQAQIDKLADDEKHRQRVAENLILLIDRLNDMRKPELIAKAWKAYLECRIERRTLFQLNNSIAQLDMENMPVVLDVYLDKTSEEGLKQSPWINEANDYIEPPNVASDDGKVDDETWQRLSQVAMCGLLSFYPGRGGAVGGRLGGLRRNELGKAFVAIATAT